MHNILEETTRVIEPVDFGLKESVQSRLDNLTKPQGSLGRLEKLALRLALIKRNVFFSLAKKTIFVLAADHGIADSGISAFPKEVTAQMVYNFLNGGAAINVLSRHFGAKVIVADMGVAHDFNDIDGLINKKINYGTKDFSSEPAMTKDEARKSIEYGITLFTEEKMKTGIDIAGIGEMGIANSSSASAITAAVTGATIAEVTGRGTGIDDERLLKKQAAIEGALNRLKPNKYDAFDLLSKVGGFEIGGMAGVILAAAANKTPVIIDGFIAGAAALIAQTINKDALHYMIPSHKSAEPGHRIQLEYLGFEPYLDLNMRLGEGTGAAIMMGLCEASRKILQEMATFADAGVSNREDL